MSIRSRLLCYSNWSSNFVPAARMSVPILRAAVNANPTSPSELWQAMVDRYDSAQAAQAATITDTNSIVVTDCGIDFVLKVATKLRDKPPLPKANHGAFRKEWRNPFLPPDPDLFVCHLSDTHSLVLNKFNIVPHHGLVITREFHPQEEPLNAEDLQATWDVMQVRCRSVLYYIWLPILRKTASGLLCFVQPTTETVTLTIAILRIFFLPGNAARWPCIL